MEKPVCRLEGWDLLVVKSEAKGKPELRVMGLIASPHPTLAIGTPAMTTPIEAVRIFVDADGYSVGEPAAIETEHTVYVLG